MGLGLSVVLGGAPGIVVGVYLSDCAVPLRPWRSALIAGIGSIGIAAATFIVLLTTGKLSFQHLSLFAMAPAPPIIRRAVDRYGLIDALHVPTVASLGKRDSGAFFGDCGIGSFKQLTSAI
jgi:hypothetical protein